MFASSKSGAVAEPTDNKFNYVTMLLHGNGTNGAQNNTFVDSSTNNFSITRNGNTTQGTFSPYGSNWSNYFDGSSYLVTSSTQIVPTGSFTVECWVYVTSTANQAFVAQGTSGNSARFSICIDGGLWWTQIGNTSINVGTPALNTWNYLAATFNGSTLTLYVNGTSVGTASTTTSAQNNTLAIGTLGAGWATSGYYVTGYISNVRVSNTVRTISTPTTPYTSDANTRLLTCAENRFFDESTNAFALTVNGSPSVQRFSPFSPTSAYSTSVIGGSGYFDGTGDYLSASTTAGDFGSSAFTIEAWVYFNSASGTQVIGSTYQSSSVGWSVGKSNSTGCFYVGLSGDGNDINGTTTVVAKTWYHIAVSGTPGATGIKLFVNGVQEGSTYTGAVSLSATVPVYIGDLSALGFAVNGYISNFRLVKGSAVYTSNFTPPTAPLTAITNTSLLLNYTNAGILDNAMMNNLETVGNAQISTSVKKYGTGSMSFDGTGDKLFVPNFVVNQLGTGDYTIEFWVYANSWSNTPVILEYGRAVSGSSAGLEFYISTTGGKLDVYGGASTATLLASYSSISATTWTYVALTRASGTTRLFINGTQSGSSATDTTNYNQATINVGAYVDSTLSVNGYIDDLRVTKGYARYTSNFTAPTAAFPNN
jgi:hypothetical protein